MTHQELLNMTHQELLIATPEVKKLRREAVNLDFHNKVKIGIDKGFKHIQIGYAGCIKVRKSKNEIFYSIRAGKGTGSDLSQYVDLRECTLSLMHNGWGNNITYK